jgi:hypothetical protein
VKKYRVRFDGIIYYPEYYRGIGFIGYWENFNRGCFTEFAAWEIIDSDKVAKLSKFIKHDKDRA